MLKEQTKINRRTAITAIATIPLAGVAKAETPETGVAAAYREFQRIAAASVPEGYTYDGECNLNDEPVISAVNADGEAIRMWLMRDEVWLPRP